MVLSVVQVDGLSRNDRLQSAAVIRKRGKDVPSVHRHFGSIRTHVQLLPSELLIAMPLDLPQRLNPGPASD
jgi:hypothetical protein